MRLNLGLTESEEMLKKAALDLIKLWISEKASHGEVVTEPKESLYSIVEVEDAL